MPEEKKVTVFGVVCGADFEVVFGQDYGLNSKTVAEVFLEGIFGKSFQSFLPLNYLKNPLKQTSQDRPQRW
jgi:hypothetical protein